MSYLVEAYWQGHSVSEHDDLVGAVNAARALADDHKGAVATISGPGIVANVAPIPQEAGQ